MTNPFAEQSEADYRRNGVLISVSYLGLPVSASGTHIDRGDNDNVADYVKNDVKIWMDVVGITEGDPEKDYLTAVAFMSGANAYKPRKGDKMVIDGTTFTMTIVEGFETPPSDFKITGTKKVG